MKHLFVFLLCQVLLSSLYAQCNLHVVVDHDTVPLCPNASDTLYTTRAYDTYQWYKFSDPIPGAIKRYLVINAADGYLPSYRVVVTKGSCTDTSKRVWVDKYLFSQAYISVDNGPSDYVKSKDVNVYCKGNPVTLTISEDYRSNVQWYSSGKPIPGANSASYLVTQNGSYTVSGTPAICPGYRVCVCDNPLRIAYDSSVASITRSGDTLFASPGKKYQWYAGNSKISGATASYYVPAASGSYKVYVKDDHNCETFSTPVSVTASRIAVAPNPAYNYITLTADGNRKGQVIISDVYGNVRLKLPLAGDKQRIDISRLQSGAYILHVVDGNAHLAGEVKFMKK